MLAIIIRRFKVTDIDAWFVNNSISVQNVSWVKIINMMRIIRLLKSRMKLKTVIFNRNILRNSNKAKNTNLQSNNLNKKWSSSNSLVPRSKRIASWRNNIQRQLKVNLLNIILPQYDHSYWNKLKLKNILNI